MNKFLWIIAIGFLQLNINSAMLAQEESSLFQLSFDYLADGMLCAKGGIHTGTAYLGMLSVKGELLTEAAGLWKNGKFYFHGANTHGGTPSTTHLGDAQVASNIEAGNHTYLQELWYSHTVGALELIVGLQDFNVHFATNEHSGLLLNSSFGIPSTFPLNMPVPIFPLTTPGITAFYTLSDNIVLQGAVFDGTPTDFDVNPHNLYWTFARGDGIFSAFEIQWYTSLFPEHDGRYAIGIFHHTGVTVENTGTGIQGKNTATGFYAMIDQSIIQQGEEQQLAAFVRTAIVPQTFLSNHFFVGGGIALYGVFSPSGQDVLAFAVAHAGLRGKNDETTFECTYALPVTSFLRLQPDVQYILHPAGTEDSIHHSLACTLRFGFEF